MTKMMIAKPPIYDEAKEHFKFEDDQPIFFTYGDTIYNPTNTPITADLIRHEETHIEQQNANDDVAVLWWRRYFLDPAFRVEQEAEAYGAQYAFLCQKHKDRNERARWLHRLAVALSGPLYGNAVSLSEASKLIRQNAEYGRPLQDKVV